MHTPCTIASVCVLLLLGACAAPLADGTRVHLGGQSFLELRLPVGWEFRVGFSEPPKVERIRIFNGASEPMQVFPVVWTNKKDVLEVNNDNLRDQAIATLKQRGLCSNETLHERMLDGSLALSCEVLSDTGGRRTIGVLANTRLTAAFSFRQSAWAHASLMWRVLETVRHFSFQNAAKPFVRADALRLGAPTLTRILSVPGPQAVARRSTRTLGLTRTAFAVPRYTELHQLLAATKRIAHELESVPDAQAAALAHALSESLRSVAESLQRPDDNAMHSQILEGAEQALRELPGLLDQVAPQFRQICQTAVQQALQAECPTFMNEQTQLLEGILRRRTITSDRDYYRVLHEIDLLERSDPGNASLAQLHAIAAQHRARHRRRGRSEA